MKRNRINELLVGVVYARYSSHNQKDTSIEQQVAACHKKAADMGIRLIDSYEDRAVTGKTDKRPNFQRMMKDAAAGKFNCVIAWKSNRMGRNMLEAMLNESRLAEYGVRVIYVEEDYDDSAAGRFALRSMMNVNQFYSESMAEDVLRAMEDNAANCKVNGRLNIGFKKGDDGCFAIDEKNAKIVEEAFVRVAALEPFVNIYNDFNIRGIRTGSGGKWNKSSFSHMLSNERYRGVYLWGNVRVEGGVPRIISDELYYRVQEVLKMKSEAPKGRHRPGGDYILTGKLFCGYCKSPMTGTSGTSKSGAVHYYYICNEKKNHTCNKKNARRDEIEFLVASALRNQIMNPDVLNWIADCTIDYNRKKEEANEVQLLKDELKQTQISIKNLLNAMEQGIITESTKGRLIELETLQSHLNMKIKTACADIIPVERDVLLAGLEMFKDGDIHDKKYQAKLIDTFLKAAYLYDDKIKLVFAFQDINGGVDIPISEADIDEDLDGEVCSFKVEYGSPNENHSNTQDEIKFIDGLFVLVLNIENAV